MFSPGEGVPPVLFPVRDVIKNRVLPAAFIEAHRDDPHVKRLIAEGKRMKEEFRMMEERNRGLTYQP